jgi:adenosylmethionine-8-amino-7-oxononanoate aminotransferase
VEVALKVALQYWRNSGKPSKDRFLCFTDGYHGDTLGAMGVSDPEKSMHKAFKHAVIPQFVVDIPSDEYGFSELENLIEGVHKQIAAMIIEPLVQGAGGMRFHSADVLAELHRLAKKYDILFIADEVATGFGRTGMMFACDEAGIAPDILCLGKALTGGTLGMGATLVQNAVFDAFLSDDPAFALMHGPTFMANPLACAAANASLDLFETEPRLAQVEAIERHLAETLMPCESLRGVADVRVKGAIGVVQLEEGRMDAYELRRRFVEKGCWVRPFKDIVYITPSFTIAPEELAQLTGAIFSALKE